MCVSVCESSLCWSSDKPSNTNITDYQEIIRTQTTPQENKNRDDIDVIKSV